MKMKLPKKEIVDRLRKEYPAGTRIELLEMDDFQAPPIGTQGTVTGVDDTGSLLVSWDTGSVLIPYPNSPTGSRYRLPL